MKYPNFIRDLIGYLPVTIDIRYHNKIGDIKCLLLKVFNLLFCGNERFQDVYIYNYRLNLDLLNKNERLLFYFPKNLINRYVKSDLYLFMKSISDEKNNIFIDIGANLGIYSMLAKSLGYKTYLFEPEPVHYSFLQRNSHIFDYVSNKALSNFSGDADFFISKPKDPGASSLVGLSTTYNSDSIYDKSIKVKVEKFDDFLGINMIDKGDVRLIKIDVEGNEYNTLRGMQLYLRDFKPYIWCEVRGTESGRAKNSYKKVTELLHLFGYKPYKFVNNNIYSFDEKMYPVPQIFDLLFINVNHHDTNY